MSNQNNNPLYEEARKAAIRFYDEEHLLTTDERKELYVFYEQLFRRTLLSSSVGFAAGVALPFFLRRGKVVNVAYPIGGGLLGGSLLPPVAAPFIYSHGLNEVQNKYGKDSRIDKVILNTPSPITKSWFWSSYFKGSSENPDMRIKDPRKMDDNDPQSAYSTPATAQSAWGRIRGPDSAQGVTPTPEGQSIYAPTVAGEVTDLDNEYIKTHPLPTNPDTGEVNIYSPITPNEVTDIYHDFGKNPAEAPPTEAPPTEAPPTENESVWDRIRRQGK